MSMKSIKNVALLLTMALTLSIQMNGQIWSEDFEVDGEGTSYTSTGTFNDGSSDHYGRTDGTDVSGGYMSPSNTFFWAGEDLDDNGSPDMLPADTLTFTGINISGVSSLLFRGLFAAGSSGGLDSSDTLYVEVSIDGGAWTTVMSFDGPTSGSNVGWAQDTNIDGVGDGVALTPTFAQFEASIPGTGTSMDLRVKTYANSGSEEFAFDLLEVYDASTLVSGCTDATALNYDPLASNDDGSCYHISIDAFNFGFNPDPFTILTGQTVRWVNTGGTHNIDGTMDVLGGGTYSNPENFLLATGGTGTEYFYTFNVAGEYDYNCSIGAHAASGMVGSFTVGTGGCTEPTADNFDPLAEFDDGSCIISGCTDPLALNYNPIANNEDGSCVYTLADLVINEIHYNPCTAQGTDGDFEFLEIYNNDGSTIDLEGYSLTYNGTTAITFAMGDMITDGQYIIIADNPLSYEGNGYDVYDATASLGNGGSTILLLDPLGNTVDEVTYDDISPWPTSPDGSCNTLELIDFTMDNDDVNNWQASFVSNGTPGEENSMAATGTEYTIQEIQTTVTAGETVITTGLVTCVFPTSFTMQDGTGAFSGIYVEDTSVAVGDSVTVQGVVAELFDVTTITAASITVINSGNTLPAYESLTTLGANLEDYEGVLVTVTGVCDDNTIGFGEWSVDDTSGPILIDDLNGNDYSSTATIGTTYTVQGPLYFSFSNYKIAPCENATDIQKHGCTNASSSNYDADALIDDGSCIVSGCTYELADNYDPVATEDDGSCTFDNVGTDCTGDADNNNVVNILDLVAVSSNFGNVCP